MRDRRRLTQEALAEISGVAQAVISRHESGKIRSPQLPTVQAFADALRCSAQYLMFGGEVVELERRIPVEVEDAIAAMRLTASEAAEVRAMAWNHTDLGDTLGIVRRITEAIRGESAPRTPPARRPGRRSLPKKKGGG